MKSIMLGATRSPSLLAAAARLLLPALLFGTYGCVAAWFSAIALHAALPLMQR
jgi:hypothetical protein